MSHHWREWQYTSASMSRRHRTWPAISTHRVAVMVDAERIPVDGKVWSHGWSIAKPGRTVCGLEIPSPDYLSPSGPNYGGSPYEAWVVGWRPCYRCFPEFDRKTLERMVAIDQKWSSKSSSRVDRHLWAVVMAHRKPSETQPGGQE